jgi:hypothetical protein
MTCPNRPGLDCMMGTACLGHQNEAICRHVESLRDNRLRKTQPVLSFQRDQESPLLHVGLVCPTLRLGGAESVDYLLARSLDRSKIRFVGAAVLENPHSTDPAAVARLESEMPIGYGTGAIQDLARHCDILISWAVIDLADLLRGHRWKPRLVQIAHFPSEAPFGPEVARLLSGVDRWVGVSELAVESMPNEIRAKSKVIWNAVDADRLQVRRSRSEMRRLWGVPETAPVAGYLGRLSPEKDPAAMARLVDSLPDPWHVVVVGSGRDVPSTGSDRFHVVGPDAAAGDTLNAFDVLVVPSLYESFGLSMAEALWMGVPIVSTNTGIAKLVPGISQTIPLHADGPTLARTVVDAFGSMPSPGPDLAYCGEDVRLTVRDRLSSARFGKVWTDFLCGLTRPRSEKLARVRECQDRGSEASGGSEGCGGCGGGPELTICERGKGKVPGKVTLRECLACVDF